MSAVCWCEPICGLIIYKYSRTASSDNVDDNRFHLIYEWLYMSEYPNGYKNFVQNWILFLYLIFKPTYWSSLCGDKFIFGPWMYRSGRGRGVAFPALSPLLMW